MTHFVEHVNGAHCWSQALESGLPVMAFFEPKS